MGAPGLTRCEMKTGIQSKITRQQRTIQVKPCKTRYIIIDLSGAEQETAPDKKRPAGKRQVKKEKKETSFQKEYHQETFS